MIIQVEAKPHKELWQEQLSAAITNPEELLDILELTTNDVPWLNQTPFPLRVARPYVAKMAKRDPNDPLLRQVLPVKQEIQLTESCSKDPLNEASYNPIPGLIHKYNNRVLLTTTSACAIHCRYCFRRHFPYYENQLNQKQWEKIATYILERPNIKEVILSGGDPLSLKDKTLAQLVKLIEQIPHVKLLRIHSRFPVVIPQRICKSLVSLLSTTKLKTTLVLHINHPAEIDDFLKGKIAQLKQHDILVLNQSVLLKGVNNCSKTLINLSYKLFDAGILPYYIHLFDNVENGSHFAVSRHLAKAIMKQVMSNLPGYLVPKLVQEVSGIGYKVPIT